MEVEVTQSTLLETVNINLEDFSDTFLTCSTCMYTYDQDLRKPKLLPCSHSVCLSCLQQLAALPQNDGCTFRCPMCRDVCVLPNGGVSSLPAAFLINQLLDVMQKQRKDLVPSCAAHSSDPLLYCESCDLVFCERCQISAFNKKCTQHTVIPFSIALKRMSEIVVYKLKGRIRSLEQAHQTVSQEIDYLDKNVDQITEQINSAIQEVSTAVENRRRELIEGLRVRRDEKRKVLKDQIEAITDERKKLEKEMDSCQVDVRSVSRRMKAMDNGWDEQLTQPKENAFLKLNTDSSQLVSDMQKCLSEYGSLSASTTFPGASVVELLGASCTHLETQLIVKTFDVNGKARKCGGDPLDVTLQRGNKTTGITVVDKDDGTYELSFTAIEPGNYTVNVNIFGRPIKNSPLAVHVSSHHRSIWQLKVELCQPTRVAVSGNTLYVLDTGNNRVRVVKHSGDVISDVAVGSSPDEDRATVGMALLDNGDIATLNWRTKTLSRMSSKGEVIKAIQFSLFELPIDLAIDSRGRYIIADSERIFVVDATLVPTISFPVKNHRITCVNVGLDDDIIVGTTSGLVVFDSTGKQQRTIKVAPTDVRHSIMVTAFAVCKDSGLIISGVVDSKTNQAQLAVSRYKGPFVYHIDASGTRMHQPVSICIGYGQHAGECFVIDVTRHTLRSYRFK